MARAPSATGSSSRPPAPAPGTADPRRAPPAARRAWPLAAIALAFVVAASVYPDALGIPSEEILPHLFRHPMVAEADWNVGERLWLEQPWARVGEPEEAGLMVSTVWPTLSVVRPPRSWPLLTESWQAAYLSYYARAVAPLGGGGIAGLRRSAALLGALGLLATAAIGSRLGDRRAAILGAALLASSVGFLFVHRTAYLIESGPPLFAAVALWLALDGERSRARLVLAGLVAGAAVALKITSAWELGGMALFLTWSRRWPRAPWWAWAAAVAAALVPLAPFAIIWAAGGAPDVIGRKLGLLAAPLEGMARLPHDAWVVLAWLGDPMALLGPLFHGARDVPPSPWSALVAGAALLWAILRVIQRRADCAPERLLLSTGAVVVTLTALFYDDAYPLQVAFLIAPWYALVVARMLLELARFSSLRLGPRSAAAAVLLLAAGAQGQELWRFQRAHLSIENPMLAGEAQRQLAAGLVRLNARRPLTTTYNQVGVLEFLSDGKVAPVHLYRLLVPRPGDDRVAVRERAEEAFVEALRELGGPVVLPTAENLFEGLHQDPKLVREAFAAACARLHLQAREVGRYPEGGRPLFEVYAVAEGRE